MCALFEDPLALKNLGGEAAWGRETARGRLEKWAREYEELGSAVYTVVQRIDGAVVGLCGLSANEDGDLEVVSMFIRRYWRRGYCREASAAVLPRAQAHGGLLSLTARMEADHPSLSYIEQAVLFAHGFVFEGEAPYPYSGKLMRNYRWSSQPVVQARAQ
ncbi:GNAT family N-acetyltransferase [Streptomyces sp. 8N114]|uniref:GNAT family N-acetyltransferase n=1 Tax=Streptomyces sp. 8N114 TaxID=3457419 RepID=UPI003FD4C7D7